MKTGRLRSKHATTLRRLRLLFVNKRRPHYSLESKLHTLLNLPKSEANSMPWQMLLRLEPRLLETHLDLVLTVLVVKARTTGLR